MFTTGQNIGDLIRMMSHFVLTLAQIVNIERVIFSLLTSNKALCKNFSFSFHCIEYFSINVTLVKQFIMNNLGTQDFVCTSVLVVRMCKSFLCVQHVTLLCLGAIWRPQNCGDFSPPPSSAFHAAYQYWLYAKLSNSWTLSPSVRTSFMYGPLLHILQCLALSTGGIRGACLCHSLLLWTYEIFGHCRFNLPDTSLAKFLFYGMLWLSLFSWYDLH